MHFWLDHTAHCAEKIVSAHLRAGSASAERVGQGKVGGVKYETDYSEDEVPLSHLPDIGNN